MVWSLLLYVYNAIFIIINFIISNSHIRGISLLAGGYVIINLIAIIMNDRVNGSKTSLAKLVFKEAFWIALLNGLIWGGESYLCGCQDIGADFPAKVRLYASYIYIGQIGLFIVLPILAIVANKNKFFKNILVVVTYIISLMHSKENTVSSMLDDDDHEITSRKSIIILPDNNDKRKGK